MNMSFTDFVFKSNAFKNYFRITIRANSFDQKPRAWSGFKLFAKVLAGK